MPRTLQSLRDTCQDDETEYQLSEASTLVDDIFLSCSKWNRVNYL